MIQKIEIIAIHTEVNDDLRKYVNKKIGKLDIYMSKHSRLSAHAEIRLKESNAKDKNSLPVRSYCIFRTKLLLQKKPLLTCLLLSILSKQS